MSYQHETAFNIMKQLVEANINPNAPGGTVEQQNQLYGVGSAIFATLAEKAEDPALNSLIELVRNIRGD